MKLCPLTPLLSSNGLHLDSAALSPGRDPPVSICRANMGGPPTRVVRSDRWPHSAIVRAKGASPRIGSETGVSANTGITHQPFPSAFG